MMSSTDCSRITGVIIDDESRLSAVIIPIVQVHGENHVLFEVRSMKLDGQPGDVCFPGGMTEPGEKPVRTAVRECCEELLISEDQIELIGPAHIFHTYSLCCYPFVAKIKNYSGSFNGEVSEVFTVPVSFFMNTEPEKYPLEWTRIASDTFPYERIVGGRNYKWRRQINYELFYDYKGRTIWGFTAKMLYYAFVRFAAQEYNIC